ncbi:hypothetical protein QVD99_002190 [Batrachochytrium dendrobatidis]|nr:hypothetical protein QVD99_002190 [Batrachochytrium dendrobatidis]
MLGSGVAYNEFAHLLGQIGSALGDESTENSDDKSNYIDFDNLDEGMAGLDLSMDNLLQHNSVLEIPSNEVISQEKHAQYMAGELHQEIQEYTRLNNFNKEPSQTMPADFRKVTFSDMIQERTISSTGNETADWSSIEFHRSLDSKINVLDTNISLTEADLLFDSHTEAEETELSNELTISSSNVPSDADATVATATDELDQADNLSFDIPDLADTGSDASDASILFQHDNSSFGLDEIQPTYNLFSGASSSVGDQLNPEDSFCLPIKASDSSFALQTPRISVVCKDPFYSEEITPKPKKFEIKSPFKESVLGAFPGLRDESDTFDGGVPNISQLNGYVQTDQDRKNQEQLENMLAELSALEPVSGDQDIGFSITMDIYGTTDTDVNSSRTNADIQNISMDDHENDEFGGSKVVDDFFQLQQDVDEFMESASNLGFDIPKNILTENFGSPGKLSLLDGDNNSTPQSPLSDKSMHDDEYILMHLEFNEKVQQQKNKKCQPGDPILSNETQTDETFATPHTVRTLSSAEVDLFSPGSFFAQKSESLGSLGGKVFNEERPTWYTPQRDIFGNVIDLIGPTPGDRTEKHNLMDVTPSGVRRVRAPLYESPSKFLDKSKPLEYSKAQNTTAIASPLPVLTEKDTMQNTTCESQNNAHCFASPATKIVYHQANPPSTVRRIPTKNSSNMLKDIISSKLSATTPQNLDWAASKLPAEPSSVPVNRKIFNITSYLANTENSDQLLQSTVPYQHSVGQKSRQYQSKDNVISSKSVDLNVKSHLNALDSSSDPSYGGSSGCLSISHLTDCSSSVQTPKLHFKDVAVSNESKKHISSHESQSPLRLSDCDPYQYMPNSDTCDNTNETLTSKYPVIQILSTRKALSESISSKAESNSIVRVIFEPNLSKSAARSAIVLSNNTDRSILWTIDSIGPVFMEPVHVIRDENGVSLQRMPKHSISDVIFRFVRISGQLGKNQSTQIAVTFKPLVNGVYTQSFQLKSNRRCFIIKVDGCSVSDTSQIPLNWPFSENPESPAQFLPVKSNEHRLHSRKSSSDLPESKPYHFKPESTTIISTAQNNQHAHSLIKSHSTTFQRKSRNTPVSAQKVHQFEVENYTSVKQSPLKGFVHSRSTDSQQAPQIDSTSIACYSHSRSHEIENKSASIRSGHAYSTTPHIQTAQTEKLIGHRPKNEESLGLPWVDPISVTNNGCSLARDSLNFGTVNLGHVSTLQLRICNAADQAVQVQFITTGPFSLPTRYLSIQPRSFVPIPIAFYPTRAGTFQERLIIKKGLHVIRVELYGTAQTVLSGRGLKNQKSPKSTMLQ